MANQYTSEHESVLISFVEDLRIVSNAGYERKADYASRLGLTQANFSQRVLRARRKGLLPPGEKGSTFYPFGNPASKGHKNV